MTSDDLGVARRRVRLRGAGRASPSSRASVVRSSSSSSSVAARAAERAVSGRRAPGIATTSGERSSSQASATSAGVASCASATSASASFRAETARRGAARRAASARSRAIPASAQRSTTPPRSARSSNGLSATCTAATGASSSASSSCGRLTFADADAPHEALVDEPGERAHGGSPRRSRIGRVDEVEVDREPVQRGEARLAVGADRLRATVRDPGAAGPRHAALRHDPRALARTARAQSAREERLVVAELVRRRGRTRARCRTP